MFEPTRGGTRGGQAEFKWSDVSADKDREVRSLTYLHHSHFSNSEALNSIFTLPILRLRYSPFSASDYYLVT